MDLGTRTDGIDVGNWDIIVDALALVLEVEARVLQCYGKLDDGLPNFVNLLLGRYLLWKCSVFCGFLRAPVLIADREFKLF